MKAQGRAAPAQERAGRLDRSGLRDFLELRRAGSLSAAARRLGVDRSTVARRVAALEATLDLLLFERGPQGWTPNAAGEEPGLVRLRGPEPVPHEPWLLVHVYPRRAPRVRAVTEWVDELVARARPALEGAGVTRR